MASSKSGQSKTARASVRAGSSKTGGLAVSSDITRIVPLNKGKNAYIRTLAGKTVHVATGSAAFVDQIAALVAEGFAGRVCDELVALHADAPSNGWDAVLASVAAVLDGPEEAAA